MQRRDVMVMPSSYALVSEDEMMYLDGGADITVQQVVNMVVGLMGGYFLSYVAGGTINWMMEEGSWNVFEGLANSVNFNRLSTSGAIFVGVAGACAAYVIYQQVAGFIQDFRTALAQQQQSAQMQAQMQALQQQQAAAAA